MLTGQRQPALARVEQALARYRGPVAHELARIVPDDAHPSWRALYEPIRQHALKPGKGLRPALCLATCGALGGSLEGALPSAAVLELYHNAFLVHDDVEDGSLLRRDQPALHALYGMPMAVNAGDAMLALAPAPLLRNMELIGVGKAIRVLEVIGRMARDSAEGQAMELDWIRRGFVADEDDYFELVRRKTASYSFVAPVEIGAIIAGAACEPLSRFALLLGTAFQIRDDVLNLRAGARWGKDPLDDLWEGKRTLVLMHALRSVTNGERARALAILDRPRPTPHDAELAASRARLEAVAAEHPAARAVIESALAPLRRPVKQPEEVAFLMELIERTGSLDHADGVARRLAVKAHAALVLCSLPPSEHQDFLRNLVDYVRQRDH